MNDGPRCRCCGIPVAGMGMRSQVRVCPICDQCDGKHGDALQVHMAVLVGKGELDPGVGLTRAIIDDAQLCGRIEFVEAPGGHVITVPNPPKRWEAVIARALCRNELPDVSLVLQMILAGFLPCSPTRAVLDAIANELREALAFIDPNVLAVEIDCTRDTLDPEHLIIKVQTSTPTIGAVVDVAPHVEIPPDIMLRARGQA